MKSARDVLTKPECHAERAAIAQACSTELQAIANHPDNRHDRGKLVDSIIALADAHPEALATAQNHMMIDELKGMVDRCPALGSFLRLAVKHPEAFAAAMQRIEALDARRTG